MRPPEHSGEPRRRGEGKVRRRATSVSPDAPSPEEQQRLLHELRVQQIELEQQNEELRQQAEQVRLFHDLPFIGMAITSPQTCRWLTVNDRLCEILGYAREELLESTSMELTHPEDLQADVAELERLLGGESDSYRMDKRFLHKDGSVVFAIVDVRCVRKDDGTVDFFASTVQDVTEGRHAEESLRRTEQQRHALLDSIPDLAWLKDRDSRFIAVNAPFGRACGLPPEQLVGKTDLDIWPRELAERYRADDRLVIESGRPKRVEEPLADSTSGVRTWIETIKVPILDSGGTVQGTVGIARDITERQRSSEELRRLNRELQESVAKLQRSDREATILIQLNDLLQSCQAADEAHRVIELSLADLFPNRSGWFAAADPLHGGFKIVGTWGAPSDGDMAFTSQECWALRRGQVHEVADPTSALLCWHLAHPIVSGYLCLPLMIQGEAIGLLHLKATTTETCSVGEARRLAVAAGDTIKLSLSNLRLREVLREQAMHDQLTGLHNRRFLDEVLPRELRRCLRNKVPLTLAIADLDYFKRFNDAYGHQAGDRLLRQLGALLKHTLRAVDIVCRFGGEEFVLVLPESPVEAVLPRLEELRNRSRELRVRVGSESVEGVSLSIGVAQAPDHGGSGDELLRAADQALYAAKAGGRDRMVVVDSA